MSDKKFVIYDEWLNYPNGGKDERKFNGEWNSWADYPPPPMTEVLIIKKDKSKTIGEFNKDGPVLFDCHPLAQYEGVDNMDLSEIWGWATIKEDPTWP